MNARTIVACLAAAPLLLAAAPEPVRLKPSSKWVIDYVNNSCRLIRTFGEGDEKTVLIIESPTPARTTMLISGKPLAGSLADVSARFRPGGAEAIGNGTISAAHEPGVLWSYIPLSPESKTPDIDQAAIKKAIEKSKREVRPAPIDLNSWAVWQATRMAFASATRELEINNRRDPPVILETGSIGEAVKMFNECGRDSLREWCLDPDVQDKIVRPVWTPNFSKWFASHIYPEQMLLEHKESAVDARLIVDATGKVTRCASLSHFDAPEFNRVVCDMFKRVKFEPAELADGTKVPSYYGAHVMFRTGR